MFQRVESLSPNKSVDQSLTEKTKTASLLVWLLKWIEIDKLIRITGLNESNLLIEENHVDTYKLSRFLHIPHLQKKKKTPQNGFLATTSIKIEKKIQLSSRY